MHVDQDACHESLSVAACQPEKWHDPLVVRAPSSSWPGRRQWIAPIFHLMVCMPRKWDEILSRERTTECISPWWERSHRVLQGRSFRPPPGEHRLHHKSRRSYLFVSLKATPTCCRKAYLIRFLRMTSHKLLRFSDCTASSSFPAKSDRRYKILHYFPHLSPLNAWI